MKTRALCMFVVTVTVLLALGATAEAQLPKRGTYSGKHIWYEHATLVPQRIESE